MRQPGRGGWWIGVGLSAAYCFLSLAVWGTAAAKEKSAAPNEQAASARDAKDLDEGEALLRFALQPWKGDLPGMVDRGVIRVLTVPNRVFFFTDKFKHRGITYEIFKAFEKDLNKRLKLPKKKRVGVLFVPVSRDELIPSLEKGIGDIAAGNLTITESRQAAVDFSVPFSTDAREVLVTGPAGTTISTLEDLSDTEILVRKSSSYHESLQRLNAKLREQGKKEVRISLADESLEDDDIAEMVNAGLYPAMVMDQHKAQLWAKIFKDIKVHDAIVLRDGAAVAWAFRKNSPKLADAVNKFVASNKAGAKLTNILIKKYLKNTRFVSNALADADRIRFTKTIDLFKKYADRYDFDWLLIVAQGYQESGLRQSAKSPAGAVGIMQVLPSTAAAPPIGIEDVHRLESNIHAGTKYLRHIVDTYFDDPDISVVDRHLFGFAAYNAGPSRINRLRKKAAKQGLDDTKWFNNVELVGTAACRSRADPVCAEHLQILSRVSAHRRGKEQTACRAARN